MLPRQSSALKALQKLLQKKKVILPNIMLPFQRCNDNYGQESERYNVKLFAATLDDSDGPSQLPNPPCGQLSSLLRLWYSWTTPVAWFCFLTFPSKMARLKYSQSTSCSWISISESAIWGICASVFFQSINILCYSEFWLHFHESQINICLKSAVVC